MANIEVSGLHYYPIKSCAGVDAREVYVTEYGFEHDREFMLVDARGQFISQRTHPELALVQPRIEEDRLVIKAPEVGEIALALACQDGLERSVTLWKRPGTGTDQGPAASEYFSDLLNEEAHLLRVAQPRAIKPECRVPGASERTAFADGFPMLLGNTASLEALNAHIATPVPMNRFRTNIDIKGALPYDEDFWRELRVGRLQTFVVRACARCPIPNIDQQTGILPQTSDRPVTKALHETRYGIDPINGSGGDFFGQNLTHTLESGVDIHIKVGDTVTIVQRAAERNVQLKV